MSSTYALPFYKFWFEVQDAEGTRIRLVVAHPDFRRLEDNKQVLPDFMEDLEAVDFHLQDDDRALENFKDRLRTFLGDELLDRYSDLLYEQEGGSIEPSDSPLLDLLIGITPGDDPTYFLSSCALLK